MIQIIEFADKYFHDVANLMARFRVTLNGFKGVISEPNIESAEEELDYYLKREYPLYLAHVSKYIPFRKYNPDRYE